MWVLGFVWVGKGIGDGWGMRFVERVDGRERGGGVYGMVVEMDGGGVGIGGGKGRGVGFVVVNGDGEEGKGGEEWEEGGEGRDGIRIGRWVGWGE